MVGNEATRGAGVYLGDGRAVLMLQNIVTDSPFGNGVGAAGESVRMLAWYNDVWNNALTDCAVVPDRTGKRGNLSVDSEYAAYGANHRAESGVTLLASSPLIDARSTTFVGADGTPADIGARGSDDDTLYRSKSFAVSLLGNPPYWTINEAMGGAGEVDTVVVGPGVDHADVSCAGRAVTVASVCGAEATAMSGIGFVPREVTPTAFDGEPGDDDSPYLPTSVPVDTEECNCSETSDLPVSAVRFCFCSLRWWCWPGDDWSLNRKPAPRRTKDPARAAPTSPFFAAVGVAWGAFLVEATVPGREIPRSR